MWMVRAAQAVVVSVLRSKGSEKSGKIGGLEQDSILWIRLEIWIHDPFPSNRAEPLDGSVGSIKISL
jgi:hypothetical protein